MSIRKVKNHLKRQVIGELGVWMKVYSKRMKNLILEERQKQARSIKWGAKQMSNMARLQQKIYSEGI